MREEERSEIERGERRARGEEDTDTDWITIQSRKVVITLTEGKKSAMCPGCVLKKEPEQ